jgi:hypothetical protein
VSVWKKRRRRKKMFNKEAKMSSKEKERNRAEAFLRFDRSATLVDVEFAGRVKGVIKATAEGLYTSAQALERIKELCNLRDERLHSLQKEYLEEVKRLREE